MMTRALSSGATAICTSVSFALTLAVVVTLSLASAAQAQAPDSDIEKGRTLALRACGPCHVVGVSQEFAPILRRPGPRFDAIAAKPTTTAESLENFLTTTHRTLEYPQGMPDPRLVDYQIREIVSYLMSLKPQPQR